MPRIILVFLIAFIVLPAGYVFAQAAKTSRGPIEVFADGKRYPSLRAYKLQRLKDNLRGVLSPGQLREFSAEEISAVILEIKTQPPVMAQPPAQDVTVPAADARVTQIEEALKDYHALRGDNPPLTGDPSKVKTIIIKPSSQDRLPDVQKTDER